MTLLFWIILFSILGGVLSVLVAALFLLVPERTRVRLMPPMLSFAIGTLLGGAFLALIPHALESPTVHDFHDVTLTILLGIMAFFLLEKFVLWRHCHVEHCDTHGIEHVHFEKRANASANASAMMIIIGDGLHNFVDGVLIAAAFITDFHLGVITSIAIAAHEVPQEVGDFIILLQSGMRRRRALLLNILSGMTSVLGAILAYFTLSGADRIVPYVLAVAAASFIYIAVADLIPGLHKSLDMRATVQQLVLISAGVGLVYVGHLAVH